MKKVDVQQRQEKVFCVFIINKSGSQIYWRDCDKQSQPKDINYITLSSNDKQFVASTFHTLYAQSSTCINKSINGPSYVTNIDENKLLTIDLLQYQPDMIEIKKPYKKISYNNYNESILPLSVDGIKIVECANYNLHCYRSLTGMLYIAIVTKEQQNVQSLLQKLYIFYTDYILKNPFQDPNMPIRSKLFDKHVASLFY